MAVSGDTPAIVTETFWHLTQEQALPISEIHVLTTTSGLERLKSTLLGKTASPFRQLCEDYGIDPATVKFDKSTIHLLRNKAGKPLADIRTDEDNVDAADSIAETIRVLTQDGGIAIHASVAGGRKTMTIYMAFALQLYGRRQDTLSHVLVNPELESCRDFFYVPPEEKKDGISFSYRDRATGVDAVFPANEARIEVARVPFVRLRHRLQGWFRDRELPFHGMVARAQMELDAPRLRIDPVERRLHIGGHAIRLSTTELYFYLYFVNRKLSHCTNADRDCFGCTACFVPKKYARATEVDAREIARLLNADHDETTCVEIQDLLREGTERAHSRLRDKLRALDDPTFDLVSVEKAEDGNNSPHGIRIHWRNIEIDA